MKARIKFWCLILSICMILSCMPGVTVFAADGAPNVSMTVDKTEVNVGDTVTVTITNGDLTAAGFGIFMEYDKELLECTSILGCDGDEYMGMYQNDKKAPWVTAQVADSVDDTNKDGIFSFGVAIGSNKLLYEGVVATLTFTAKAAGAVNFVLNEDTAGTDAFKGIADTKSVTIVDPNASVIKEATITFDTKDKRTEYSKSVQVWKENGITVTNEKGSSTSNVGDYAKPARFYKSSTLTIAYPGMTKIEVACNSTNYATALKDSITDGTVTIDGKVVTIVLSAAADTYSAVLSSGQVRVDSITVYYAEGTGSGETPECAHTNASHVEAKDATCQAEGNLEYWYCGDCRKYFSDAEYTTETTLEAVTIAKGDHTYTEVREGTWKCACGYYKPDSTLTIPEASEFGGSFAHNTYTAGKYYVTGVIQSIASTTYGDMTIVDAEGKTLYLYGLYSADGETRYDAMDPKPVVGDTITVYGILGTYNDAPQMKDAWMTAHTHEHKAAGFESDDNNHWKVCACGAVIDGTKAEHVYTDRTEYVPGAIIGTHQEFNYCECGALAWGDSFDCVDKVNNETKEPGADGNCDVCGEHKCVMTLVPGKAPTCIESGHMDYYHCDGCGSNYYIDHEMYQGIDNLDEWKAEGGDGYIGLADHTCNHTNHKCAVCGTDVPVYLIVKDQAQKDAYSDMIQLTDPDGDGVYTATFKLNDEVPNGQFDISLYHADGTLCGAHTGVYGGYKGKFDQLTFTVKYTPAEKRLDIITDCSHALDHYEVNDDGTHTAYCSCGTDIGTLSGKHDYTTGTKDHTCVCGDVEKFILTIDTIDTTSTSLPVSRTVTLEVPYGTKVMEVLQQAIEDGKITAPNTLFRQKTPYFDGYATTTQYYLNYDVMNELDDQYTMPAYNITVSQGNTVYTGWGYYYTGDQLDGAEYILKGEWLQAGWYFIEEDFDDVEGGAWYCFVPGTGDYAANYNFRVEGTARVPYPTVAINGVTYGANAEDKAYWEAHKDTSKYTDAESALFIFDENGKFQQTTGIVGGNRYAVNGMIGWHVGLVEVDGEYYYFGGDVNGNGNIMMTGNIYASRNTTDLEIVKGGIYTFGEDGKLCKYDGITEIDGKLYYYDHYRLATNAGLIKIDGNYYYVRSGGDKAGQLVVGRDYWITNTNGLLVAGMYTFGADGKIVMGAESEELDGIVNVDGTLYYYKGGVKQIGAGVVQLTDENGETFYIYVRSDGRLATGIYWPTTLNGLLERGAYDWGTDGRYYPAED